MFSMHCMHEEKTKTGGTADLVLILSASYVPGTRLALCIQGI